MFKLTLISVICFAGSFITLYISHLPEPLDPYTLPDTYTWSVWDYLSLLFFMTGVALIIAMVKLVR
jgi:hypothetical protein